MRFETLDAHVMRGELYTMVYPKTIAEAVRAGGYDYINPAITDQNFPAQRRAELVDFRLVYFDELTEAEDIVMQMLTWDNFLQPATLPELLTFGVEFPDIQRKFPIAALGSSRVFGQSPGVRVAPYLGYDDSTSSLPHVNKEDIKRVLQLGAWNFGWSTAFRFLAVEFVI